MRNIIDYKVLTAGIQLRADDIERNGEDIAYMCEKLRDKVIKHINEGYQPFGGIATTMRVDDSMLYLVQAVVKYE